MSTDFEFLPPEPPAWTGTGLTRKDIENALRLIRSQAVVTEDILFPVSPAAAERLREFFSGKQ